LDEIPARRWNRLEGLGAVDSRPQEAGLHVWARQNQNPDKEIKARHNKIQAWCNKIKIRRNEIQTALPSMNLGFSTGYRRFRPAFAGV
jgi:hypothetical protein